MKTLTAVLFCFFLAANAFAAAFTPVTTEKVVKTTKAKTLRVELNGADDLYLVADYAGDSYDFDQAVWAEPTLYDKNGNAVRLTTLKPESAKTGCGTLIVDKNHKNEALNIAGEKFRFGFWAHAPSILHFKLDGKYTRLETKVGLDSGAERGTVIFQVRSDSVPFPAESAYKKGGLLPNQVKPWHLPEPITVNPVPSVADADVQFNADAAKQLLDKGIEEIVFIRRNTYTSSHTYTEYVDSYWTPGGGLCVLNLKTGKVREIVPELTKNGVVGWFDVSFDAKKIVFDFKKAAMEGYRIYEVNVDGTGLKQLTFPEKNEAELVQKYKRGGYHRGTDDIDPCYLPDGGIAFTTTRCQYSVLCDSSDNFTVRNMYRMDSSGADIKPLTVSPLSEMKPSMMQDGRILYSRWEYVDKAAGNVKSLWSMNPDGTGSAEIYGNTITFPETMVHARQIPGEPNKIVMTGCSHWINSTVGTIIEIDTTKNIRSPETMKYVSSEIAAFAHDGFHFKDANGKWFHDKTGKQGRLFRNPYPVSSELFIVSHKPKGLPWSELNGYDLSLLDGSGKETLLLKDPTISLWTPYPLVPREKPPVPTGMTVDKELAAKGLAKCIVTDVYVGMDNVKRGEVKYLRVLEQLPRPWNARKTYGGDGWGMSHSAIGDGFLSPKVQYGVVPVEEDGSAQFLVPANRPIYFQALDKNYNAIQTERTYVNYNPGETRSCVGCHETPDMSATAQRSAVPKSLKRPPSVPMPQLTQDSSGMVFDYDRQIQPIWNKHCVECHNPNGKDAAAAKLNLLGTPQGVYSASYEALMKLSKQKNLLGNRHERDENSASNKIEYIAPYKTGALSSPLAVMLGILTATNQQTAWDNKAVNDYAKALSEGHKDVKLSDSEKLTAANWLDINCQFHPSYWGKKHEKFKNEPDYRPALTFDEARSGTMPVVKTVPVKAVPVKTVPPETGQLKPNVAAK
ncbi:MAG: NPCBM/NEW2 domain-containing protein [Planctomycetaceae bacterium]|jgi:hypothetical protein|nr:NPCBM/NEW2 domain-containing protein [Planctomycetaceae bacterium]